MENKKIIKKAITKLEPFDQKEKEDIQDALAWIDATDELYRIKKPDIPPKHLVSYFVPIHTKTSKLLLVNHIKAGLLLPPGGHVEYKENPRDTVKRECMEELQQKAIFRKKDPFFITITKTVNTASPHTDVSLWYILKNNVEEIVYDPHEFTGYHWMTSTQILLTDKETLDPNMHRFIKKLQKHSITY